MKKRLLFWILVSIAIITTLLLLTQTAKATIQIEGALFTGSVTLVVNNSDSVDHLGIDNQGGWVEVNITGLVLSQGSCNETRLVSTANNIIPYQVLSSGVNLVQGQRSCYIGFLSNTTIASKINYTYYYGSGDSVTSPSYPTYRHFFEGWEDGDATGWQWIYGSAANDYFPVNSPYRLEGVGRTIHAAGGTIISGFVMNVGTKYKATFNVIPDQSNCTATTGSPLFGIRDNLAAGQNPEVLVRTNQPHCGLQVSVNAGSNYFNITNNAYMDTGAFNFIELRTNDSISWNFTFNYTHSLTITDSGNTNPVNGTVIGGASDDGVNATFDNIAIWNYSVSHYAKMDGVSFINRTTEIPIVRQCAASDNPLFNFTFWQERTEQRLFNHSKFEATFFIYEELNISNNGTSSISINATSNVTLCTSANGAYRMISNVEYSRPEYDKRFYYLFNYSIMNTSLQHINLYLLEISLGDPITFHVTDENDGSLGSNIYVKIQRYYAGSGTFKTIAMLRPDDVGNDLTYLRKNDVWYKFIVQQNEGIIYISDPRKIFDDDVYIRIPLTPLSQILTNFNNLVVSLNFDNVTRNYTAVFTQTNGIQVEGCLNVIRRKFSGDTFVCQKCETSNSATLICGIGAENTTYIGTFTGEISGVMQVLKSLEIFLSESLARTFGEDGIVLSAFIFLFLVFVGAWNPSASIGLGLIALVLTAMAGFYFMSFSALLGIIFAGGWLMFKTRT